MYDDGPINGAMDAWTINFGLVVSDTFTVSSGTSNLTRLTFGAWVIGTDDHLGRSVIHFAARRRY